MSKFGAYREGLAPFVFGDDVWELIGRVVPLAAREGWLPELRVGPMVGPHCDGRYPLPIMRYDGVWKYGSQGIHLPGGDEVLPQLNSEDYSWRWTGEPNIKFNAINAALRFADDLIQVK